MRLVLVILYLALFVTASGQQVKVTPFFSGGVPYELYAGRKATFNIEHLPERAVLKMRHGIIRKMNGTTYSISEHKCNLSLKDTLEIKTDKGFYQAISFNVIPSNDTALYVRYGQSCTSIMTKEELLQDETLYVIPESVGYTVDSFTIVLLPKRGEYITFKMTGNKPSGTNWERIKKHLKAGDVIFLDGIYCSRNNGRERRMLEGVHIRIK